MSTSRRQFLFQVAAMGAAPDIAVDTRMVQTVRGPIDVSKLGFTLSHEHICNCTPGFWEKWPKSAGGREGLTSRAVEQLKALEASGVDTLIDLTPYDVGRDIRLIEEVSHKSGIQIVACTGQHLFAPPSLVERPTEALTEFFIREIEQGIDGTGIKAGVIKVATANDVVTAPEERALRAAARASRATGVRIATYTHARLRGGEKQAEIFGTEGISPARVSLGHSDDSGDIGYLAGLARRGYTLGMGHINRGLKPDARVSWQARAAHIKQLIDMGFVDRLFLSQDTVLGTAMLPPELRGEREKTNPDGWFFNTRTLIPHLQQIGVSPGQIRIMTVENPRRFFGRLTRLSRENSRSGPAARWWRGRRARRDVRACGRCRHSSRPMPCM
jgi:phosphotriesterase-related protein